MKFFYILLLSGVSLYSLTLNEAIDRATQNSPQMRKANSNLNYSKFGILEAEASFHPSVDAGFTWQDTDENTALSFSPSHSYSLSAHYNIFNGFSNIANINAKKSQNKSQKLLVKAQKSDLRFEVIEAYVNCLKAKKLIQTQEDNLRALERSYSDTAARYEQGMIAKNELLLIDVQRLRSRHTLAIAKSDFNKAHYMLWRVLGGDLEHDEVLEEVENSIYIVEKFQDLLKNTYLKYPHLHALYKQRDALQSEKTVASGAFYPRVDVSATYTLNEKERSYETMIVQAKDQKQALVNVTWNLYNGRSDEAKRRGAIEQIIAKNADIDSARHELEFQLNDALQNYNIAKSEIDISNKTLQSAKENYRITNDRYEYGETSTLNLLTAQSDFTVAQNDFNNANYNLFIAIESIKKITGSDEYE